MLSYIQSLNMRIWCTWKMSKSMWEKSITSQLGNISEKKNEIKINIRFVY